MQMCFLRRYVVAVLKKLAYLWFVIYKINIDFTDYLEFISIYQFIVVVKIYIKINRNKEILKIFLGTI